MLSSADGVQHAYTAHLLDQTGGWSGRTSVVSDPSQRLIDALTALEEVADEVSADEAVDVLEGAALQLFWRDWPALSGWAGAVWRRLNADMDRSSQPVRDPDLDEVGGNE
jgi:hypothetical protein